jgi:hypothetical protein
MINEASEARHDHLPRPLTLGLEPEVGFEPTTFRL